MTVGDWVWYVNSSGDVYYGTDGVGISYGRLISPNMDWVSNAYLVYPDGDVHYLVNYGVMVSYGSPYTGWMQYSLANLLSPEGELILSDGSMPVFDSYGKTFSEHNLSKFFTYR